MKISAVNIMKTNINNKSKQTMEIIINYVINAVVSYEMKAVLIYAKKHKSSHKKFINHLINHM